MFIQSIRNRAQGWLAWLVVGLISIPFALWGINSYLAPQPQTAVAEVNGIEISQQAFQGLLQQQLQQMQAQFPNQDFASMESFFKNQLLNNMINEEVLVQTAMASDMRVGNDLLAGYIHSLDDFKKDGVFSQSKYKELLSQAGYSPALFETRIKRDLLTEQLRNGVEYSTFVTDREQKQYEQLKQQQRLISHVLIAPEKFTVKATEAEIKKYYTDHQADHFTPEKVSVNYIELKAADWVSDTAVDDSVLKQRYAEQKASFTIQPQWRARHILFDTKDQTKAKAILGKAKAGEDFAALAKAHSQDKGSASKGGDLGFFGKGQMVKEFEQATAKLKAGEISDLVKSSFGYHIIKLEETKPESIQPFAEVREQLRTAYLKEQGESVFYEQRDTFANLAFEHPDSLDLLAKNLKLKVQTSPLFERNQGEGISKEEKVRQAAFSDGVLREGKNSEVLELGEQHIMVLRIKDHQTAKAKPLASVKAEIKTLLQQQKQQKEAESLGEKLLAALRAGKNPDSIMAEQQLQWQAAQWIGRDSRDIEPAVLVGVAFQLPAPEKDKALYHGLSVANGYAIMALLEIKTPEIKNIHENESFYAKDVSRLEYQTLQAALQAAAKIKRFNLGNNSDTGG